MESSIEQVKEIIKNRLEDGSICVVSVNLFKGKIPKVNVNEDIYLEGKEPQAK